MHRLAWLASGLALVLGAWLTFDGGHALVVGDYVTPSSGPYAGQLGPWAGLASAAGIDPRSLSMKVLHGLLGLSWLAVAACFALRMSWAWWGMLACAALSLWYLPFGTLIGVAEIILLLLPALRNPAS